MPSPLAERFGLPAQAEEDFLVRSGSPARYRLSAGPSLRQTISAMQALARRHVRIGVAKKAIESVLVQKDVVVDLPMLEDADAFERELAALGVHAVPCGGEASVAAVADAKAK